MCVNNDSVARKAQGIARGRMSGRERAQTDGHIIRGSLSFFVFFCDFSIVFDFAENFFFYIYNRFVYIIS